MPPTGKASLRPAGPALSPHGGGPAAASTGPSTMTGHGVILLASSDRNAEQESIQQGLVAFALGSAKPNAGSSLVQNLLSSTRRLETFVLHLIGYKY